MSAEQQLPTAATADVQRRNALFATNRIPRRAPDDPCPLSFPQQRLWFLDQLQPANPTYNIPYAFRIRGPLNVDALQSALDALVERHTVLRTMFASVDGDPLPIIASNWSVPLEQIDLRDSEEACREAEAHRLLTCLASKPFDFSRDVMLRAALLRLTDEEYLFLHVSHHIAWEYWSTAIMYRDLGPLYEQYAYGRECRLAELPIQYADFALWQRRFLGGEVLETLISYWKQQLQGAPHAITLPLDKPRPPVHTLRGTRYPLVLDDGILEEARLLSLKSGVTPFMSLCAAFNVLLYCCTGQDDICLGSPVARARRAEMEGLIGFFVNTLVLRTRLDGSPTFRELMARISRSVLGAILHGDLPFDTLVEAMRPPRDLSRMPLFQVNFRVQKSPLAPMEAEGLEIDPPVWIDNHTTKFDLSLEIVATGGAEGFFEYSTDLFEETTIAGFAKEFKTLLSALVRNPDTTIDALPEVVAIRGRYAARGVQKPKHAFTRISK